MRNGIKVFLVAGWAIFGVLSCNFDDSSDETVAIDSPAAVNTDMPSLSDVPEVTPATSVGQVESPVTTPALALNPAHGQPGHDCAVAVGAPLSGSATTPFPAPAPVVVAPVQAPAAPSMNANARINPAHGQPGHDCAVAVGAPLPGK